MCSQTAGISTSVENAEESGDVGLTGTIGGHVSVMWRPEQGGGGSRDPEGRLCICIYL